MTEHLDEITAIYYQNCGFDPSGTYRRAYKTFLTSMYMAQNLLDIESAYRAAKLAFAETPLEKPAHPLRVGIVGDFYTALDSFSNLEVEQKLADMGVEVWRWTNLTNRMLHYTGDKNLHVSVAEISGRLRAMPQTDLTAFCISNPQTARRRSISCPCCKIFPPTIRFRCYTLPTIHRQAMLD